MKKQTKITKPQAVGRLVVGDKFANLPPSGPGFTKKTTDMKFKIFNKWFMGAQKTEAQPDAVIIPPSWMDVRSVLPPLFQKVIVWGRVKSRNVCHQMWEARRWTGCTSGFDVEGDKCWEWVTPTDGVVHDVTHWFSAPDVVVVPDKTWTQSREAYRIEQETKRFGQELAQKV